MGLAQPADAGGMSLPAVLLRLSGALALLGALLAAPLATAATTFASPAQRVTLLELYTSEGCSSCPPAERWLNRFTADPRLWRKVVPLAFHVDYWNSLGWPDRFASPRFSRRQRTYAEDGLLSSVYTPGFVVNGREWRGWFSRPRLSPAPGAPAGVLSAEVAEHRVSATFTPVTNEPRDLLMHIAVLGFGLTTAVRAGENAGATLHHDFVVLGYTRVPLNVRQGRYQLTDTPLPPLKATAPRLAVALWVSKRHDPQPIQAAGAWLRP